MKPSDNEIEMLAAGFAIQHKNGLIRFAHALLEKYASARAIALDASTVVGEAQPVAYLTRDEEGSPCMLFFDVVEARGYCALGEEPEPLFLHAAPRASESDFAKLQSAYVAACHQIAELLAEKQASAENDWKAAIRKFMDTAIPALAAIANVHTPDEIDALDAMPREPVIDQVRRLSQACEALSRQVRPERPKEDKYGGQQRAGEVLFWYRPRSDGWYEGPIHNDRIEEARKVSGVWVPLVAAPQASALNAEYTRGRADGFDAGHSAALEKAAAALEDHRKAGREWVPGSLWDTLSREAAYIRALKQPQADKDGSQQRAAEASAPDTAKDRVDKILRERMAPISEALGLDVMLASVFKDGFQIITFEFETLVYSIGSDGAAILRVSFNCSHAPDTLTADQVQIISQAAAEVRPVGGEVLAWLDQHRGVTSRPATAMSSLELYRQWRAAEQAQAAAPCTCPSGDGSLRHPCAAHPAKASGNGGEEWSDS